MYNLSVCKYIHLTKLCLLVKVTHRDYATEDAWSKWQWRSEGDVMMNGAFFVESGVPHIENPFSRVEMIQAKPGSYVTRLTRFAGALDCKPNQPCWFDWVFLWLFVFIFSFWFFWVRETENFHHCSGCIQLQGKKLEKQLVIFVVLFLQFFFFLFLFQFCCWMYSGQRVRLIREKKLWLEIKWKKKVYRIYFRKSFARILGENICSY